ncbi:lytic transglycosylase domain-containing protein [Thermoactinomyces sp. DSM 45892]|uniref:lytic transglycosylase domain-containing protein n=1 Tax=Thermoactinomyces sp. DSM 45892 TaxID=1882753 RepID=UPI000894F3D4|nr:lytic transglycosylase domain-containing protein [Thermoactinomyces sp. DSM 45892]SDZ12563.1 soluble lytic murein transglycosylase [Thermoactinomyces sp. DSM 45892]
MELSSFKKWIDPALRAMPPKRMILTGIILIVLIMFIAIPVSNRWMYPLKYEEDILNSAKQYKISPFLVMAVIRVETKFDPSRVSHANAQGLMQITPGTVDTVIKNAPFSPAVRDQIGDPKVNIQLGTWYLAYLIKEFNGNEAVAVAAYNAGPNKVKSWLKDKKWDGTVQNANRIEYSETRKYVQKVMGYYGKYKSVYGSLVED